MGDTQALVSSSNSSGDQRHLRTISDHTRGIAFLGTPHSGSAIAKWGELVRKTISPFTQTNKQILAVLMKDSEALERVQTSFHAMIRERSQDEKRAIAITCFYEELSMAGVGYGVSTIRLEIVFTFRKRVAKVAAGQVVSRNSAELLGYPAISIRGNHVTMTKFKDEDDQGFRSVYGELQRWAKDFCNANGKYPHELLDLSFNSTAHKDGSFSVDGGSIPRCTTALLLKRSPSLSLVSQAD